MEAKFKRSLCVLVCMIMVICTLPVMAGVKKMNINTAPKEQLTTLKYVGDALADRIIEFRNSTPFTNIEDFMKVKGIGSKAFAVNKDQICVTDE